MVRSSDSPTFPIVRDYRVRLAFVNHRVRKRTILLRIMPIFRETDPVQRSGGGPTRFCRCLCWPAPPRPLTHRIGWRARGRRSACDGEPAGFPNASRLVRGHFLGRHPIRLVSGRLVQSPDGVFAKNRTWKTCCDIAADRGPRAAGELGVRAGVRFQQAFRDPSRVGCGGQTRTVKIRSRTPSVNQYETYERGSDALFGRSTMHGRHPMPEVNAWPIITLNEIIRGVPSAGLPSYRPPPWIPAVARAKLPSAVRRNRYCASR